jgi:predicted dehydrogenase
VHLGIEAEDTECASLHFGSGALGTIEATTAAYPGWERRIEICGESGGAAIEYECIVRWEFREATAADAPLLASAHNLSAGSGAGAPDQINFGPTAPDRGHGSIVARWHPALDRWYAGAQYRGIRKGLV